MKTFTVASLQMVPPEMAFAATMGRNPNTPGSQQIVHPADALYFACDLVHEGVNGNKDIFTREEMEKAWPTLIGMAVDKDHIMHVDGVVGQIYDVRFLTIDGVATIRVAGYINAGLYPDVAWKIRAGIVRGVSMECLFEQGIATLAGRRLKGINFIGLGLTRLPADDQSLIDHTRESQVTASQWTESDLLLYAAAHAVAGVS